MSTLANAETGLDRETLRDVIDLSLWAGQMLLQSGAGSQRVEETVHRLGTGLGCDWMDVLVSPNALIVTTISGQEFRTKIRRVVSLGVNMNVLTEINQISRLVTAGHLDRFQLRAELERIDKQAIPYSRWQVVLMVGLSCAAISRLLDGDWPVFAVTFVAASLASLTQQTLRKRTFNPFLTVVATAFAAGFVASSAFLFNWSPYPEVAMISAVLPLVPGVLLINAAEDFLKGHLVVGLVRGLTGGIISLAIALGLLFAMWLTGIRNIG